MLSRKRQRAQAATELAGPNLKGQKKLGKGKPQIWLIPADGGEARQLTFAEHGASYAEISSVVCLVGLLHTPAGWLCRPALGRHPLPTIDA